MTPESRRLIANGLPVMRTRLAFSRFPGTINMLSLAGPASVMTSSAHCMCVMCHRRNAITKEQADYLDHKGSYLPAAPPAATWIFKGSTKC